MIKVILADDHPVVRAGLRQVLELHKDIVVVGEAADGRESARQACRLKADVVVMDITMPKLNGIDATRRIREYSPTTQVVMLSMHATSEYVHQSLKAGALGYVLKESAGEEVVDAVYAVHRGRRFLGEGVRELVRAIAGGKGSADKGPLERLSEREREILQLVVEGKSSAAIGRIVFLSRKTVETYRCRLMAKLGIRNVPDLVRFAIEHGLSPLER